MLGCTFCGRVAESFTALTHPGTSVGRLGLCCWQTGTTIAQLDSRYMNKAAQVYCTVWQPFISAEGLTNGGFSGTDKLLVGNYDLSTQKWQGCSCWFIPMYLPLLYHFCLLINFFFVVWFDSRPFPFLNSVLVWNTFLDLLKNESLAFLSRENSVGGKKGEIGIWTMCTWLE